MKLIRFGEAGKEAPGIIINGRYYDLSDLGEDYNEKFFETGGLKRIEKYLSDKSRQLKEVSAGIRLGPPIERPSKIVCIGLNYADHAKETNAVPPTEPVIFLKSTTAITGPNDPIILPKNSTKTDWEVELAVI